MNAEQKALWQRLQAHALDDAQSARPFSLRLATENNWGPAFTQRVIEEYRRFAFLAVAAGHSVSPSDVVDQAWHLHLLYTRDYWGEFCGQVLGRPFHHGPTRGGAAEADKFTDWYAQTRGSYRTFFGEPPVDIWPEAPRHPHAVRVDAEENWVIPKPRLLRRLAKALSQRKRPSVKLREAEVASRANPLNISTTTGVAALMVAAISLGASRAEGAVIHGGPFELAGPEFLKLFLAVSAGVLGLALLLRWLGRGSAESDPHETLDGYEAAYLVGGKPRVFHTALASLSARGLIDVQDREIYRKNGVVSPFLPLIERAVVQAARIDGEKIRVVRRQVADVMESMKAGLRERGLVMHAGQKLHSTLWSALLAAGMSGIALNKIFIGLDRNRPVTFLIALCALWVLGFVLLLTPPRTTRKGARLLAKVKDEHRNRTRAVPEMVSQGPMGATHFALIVGLFGWTALRGTPLADLQQSVTGVQPGDGSSVSWGSDGGGDSGGGSSCGGGDGGGGGCGGCGGGGGD